MEMPSRGNEVLPVVLPRGVTATQTEIIMMAETVAVVPVVVLLLGLVTAATGTMTTMEAIATTAAVVRPTITGMEDLPLQERRPGIRLLLLLLGPSLMEATPAATRDSRRWVPLLALGHLPLPQPTT